MELRCHQCGVSLTTVPVAKTFPCGHRFCQECDDGDELQWCYVCRDNLNFGCGIPDPLTHTFNPQQSHTPPHNTPQPHTSPMLRPHASRLNSNTSTAARRKDNSDAIYEIVHNVPPATLKGCETGHPSVSKLTEWFEQLNQKPSVTTTRMKGKEEEDSRAAHSPCLPSTRQEGTHNTSRNSLDLLRTVSSSPQCSEAYHSTIHKSLRSRGSQPYPSHPRTKDLYLTPSKTREPSPSPCRTRELSPSPCRTREPSPSPSRTREPSPSSSKTREPSPAPSRTREPSPAPSRTRKPSPSPSRTREPSCISHPSSSRTRSPAPPPSRVRTHPPSRPSSRDSSSSRCSGRDTSSTSSRQNNEGVGSVDAPPHHTASQQPLIKPPLTTNSETQRTNSTLGRSRRKLAVDGIASVHQNHHHDSASHALPYIHSAITSAPQMATQIQRLKEEEEEEEIHADLLLMKLLGLSKELWTELLASKEAAVLMHGLPNLGNSCYINSVVQCLYHLPSLRACLTEHVGYLKPGMNQHSEPEGKVAMALTQLFMTLETGKGTYNAARILKDVLGSCDEAFESYKQQEAHDLLSSLLQWLDDDLSKGNESSPISTLFQGRMESRIRCSRQRCTNANTTETFTSLSLPVAGKDKWTLQGLLHKHFETQSLEWDCERCCITHPCTHDTCLLHCPPVLIIHLSRYRKNPNSRQKERVKFPLEGLTLQAHMAPGALRSPRYQLAGVVCHEGTQRSGHYLAYCRSGGRGRRGNWKLFNDEQVIDVVEKRVESREGAHLLFYLKQED